MTKVPQIIKYIFGKWKELSYAKDVIIDGVLTSVWIKIWENLIIIWL